MREIWTASRVRKKVRMWRRISSGKSFRISTKSTPIFWHKLRQSLEEKSWLWDKNGGHNLQAQHSFLALSAWAPLDVVGNIHSFFHFFFGISKDLWSFALL
ncbi:hypothetical protein ACLB2K_074885 [Fragaria x ananassa]